LLHLKNNNDKERKMSSKKEIVTTEKAPKAIGPYSAGVKIGNFVYTAGQLGIDPKSGKLVTGGVEAETRQALMNISEILKAAGVSLSDVVKTTVFLQNMDDFGVMNVIYGEFFQDQYPARSTIQVAKLPLNAAIEVEAIAVLE
jgi:2-iminobutanoate/2-iminopropanoate deaminase